MTNYTFPFPKTNTPSSLIKRQGISSFSDKVTIGRKRSEAIQELRLGELFCGPGGLAIGAKKAVSINGNRTLKIKHAWANDYDEYSCKTYRRNICENRDCDTVICEDVRKLEIETLPPIDAFAYGFPCNDFSIVGKQKGFDGNFGPLYTYGLKVINCFKPKFFVAENVGGLSSANGGKAFEAILKDLSQAGNGYEITAHLYKSEEYGVPQTRHRIVIVGFDKALGLKFKVPKPTHKDNYVTAKEALHGIKSGAYNNDHARVLPAVVERLKHIKPGENAWTADLPEHLQLNVKVAKMSQIYKRLHPDKPAYTITGSGGGGTHGYHYSEPRPLTNRERARIQSFPDDYFFEGSREKVRKQIGMAVPPKLSQVIFQAILDTLNGIEYLFVLPNK